MEPLGGAPPNRLPLVPGGRLLALEPGDQLGGDERLVEDDRLVVGAVAHRERDDRAQSEVAIRLHYGLERGVLESLELVQEVDDARRAGAQDLDPAEEGADIGLAGRLARRRERWVREQHPRLQREVVPDPAEPVLVRVAVGVHHPRDDGEARAVDVLRVGGRRLGDAPAVDRDVGAAELPCPDVDEPVPEK